MFWVWIVTRFWSGLILFYFINLVKLTFKVQHVFINKMHFKDTQIDSSKTQTHSMKCNKHPHYSNQVRLPNFPFHTKSKDSLISEHINHHLLFDSMFVSTMGGIARCSLTAREILPKFSWHLFCSPNNNHHRRRRR